MALTYESLTTLLRCPVCLGSSKRMKMYVCCVGHNVCNKCLPKLDKCPLCNGCFRGTRNFVAEGLIPHLRQIKKLFTSLKKKKPKVVKKTPKKQTKPKVRSPRTKKTTSPPETKSKPKKKADNNNN